MNLRTKLEPILPFTVGHPHSQATYTRVAWKPNKFVVNAVNHVAPHTLSLQGGTASSNHLSVVSSIKKTLGFQPFLTRGETSFVPDFVPKRMHKGRVHGPTFRLGGESRIFFPKPPNSVKHVKGLHQRFHGTLSECLMILSCHLTAEPAKGRRLPASCGADP